MRDRRRQTDSPCQRCSESQKSFFSHVQESIIIGWLMLGSMRCISCAHSLSPNTPHKSPGYNITGSSYGPLTSARFAVLFQELNGLPIRDVNIETLRVNMAQPAFSFSSKQIGPFILLSLMRHFICQATLRLSFVRAAAEIRKKDCAFCV